MKKKQKLKERICALVLALAMVLTWVLPDAGMTVQAAAGDAKKVTLKFKDAAEETRGIGALTLKLQSNDDPSYEKKKEIEVKAGETSKEIELKEGVEYNYEVEKTGYETTKDGRFTVEAEKADIDILLTMSEITLLPTTDSVSLKVGETYDISVTNPVQELAYTWSTTDGNVASVENGKVTAKGEGSADISVTNGVKTKTVSVNVSKNQINGFSMTVKEPSGDDQSSVILTAKGLPADVSGNVIFYDVTGGQKTLLYKAEAAATVEYTYETDSLLGAKQFEAVYSGNEKYEGATATATGSYGKTQAITIDGDVSKEVTYGTEHWNDEIVIALADIENTLKGRTLATEVAFAQSEDAPNTGLAENVANVRVEESNHTIHVIPQNAGKITIKIKAVPGEGNFYREASVDYTLTVKRQEVSFENVTWNKASKVYDGNTEIELTENIIREGTELLNNSSLQGYMKRNKEQKAEVLHAVGDGYFYSEQYDTAGKYYEEALSCDSRNSLYVRDYMTAMARNGSPVDVWTIQSEYPEAAIDEAATVFVQAQSMYAKGDQKSAVSLCEEALGKSMDAELNAQIYLLEAELYLEQGDINSAADAAAQAVKLDESSNVLRKAAVTAYQAGNEERIGTVKNQWYRQALAYYEMLCQKNDPSYEDRLGRALLLRVLGKYRDSTDVLEEMKIDYPKDYKVQMWICYNYLDEASEEGTYSNVSGDLKFTYHSCRNLYENRADRSEEDPDMEMLEETMKELE